MLAQIEEEVWERFADLKDKLEDASLQPRVPLVARYIESYLKNNRPTAKMARHEGAAHLLP